MPNRLLVIFLFSMPLVCAFGQTELDSLKNQLDLSDDSLKVEIFNKLSKAHHHTDPEKSLEYALQGEQLAKELGDLVLIGKMINAKGVSYYYLNELDLSNEGYFEALNIFDSVDYKAGVARALNNIAWNYKIQKLYDEAIKYFNQSLEITKEIDDLDLQQGILNNLGTVYRSTGNHDKALEIYMQSLRLNKESGNKMWEAYNLNNIGLIYMDKRQFDDALTHLDLAKKINMENNYIQELSRNMLNIGSVYTNKGDFLVADLYLDSAYVIIDEHGFKRVKQEYYGYKVYLYENSRNYRKALDYEQLHNELNIELNQVAWNEKVTELQAKYDVAQKERELEASERKISQQRLVIIGGTSLFLLLLGILFLVLNLYKLKNRRALSIEKLNDEIKQKNKELSFMNEEIQGVNNTLENMVEKRTNKIKTQNEKLVKYAFINSHEIRGPLARVLGLLYLMGLENKILNNDVSFKMLNEATHDLDDVIKEASQLLEDEDIFDKK